MTSTIGVYSYLAAALLFLILVILLLISRRNSDGGTALIVASILSLGWALLASGQALEPVSFLAFGGLMESIRILSWAYFLNRALSLQKLADELPNSKSRSVIRTFLVLSMLVIGAHVSIWLATLAGSISGQLTVRAITTVWIFTASIGLFCLERLYRATPPERRSAMNYLAIGLGTMFLFDFIVFTDSNLFTRINVDLWFARGYVYACLVPLIGLAIARNPQWSVDLHVSRQAVTTSITAIAGGGYLIATTIAAYFVRYSGAEWASVAEVVVILLSATILTFIIFSTTLRSRLRVFVSKHLFNFKYDYRHEWLKFTNTLATQIGDAPQAVLQGLTGLVNSQGGVVWRLTETRRVEIIASNSALSTHEISYEDAEAMQNFMLRTQWIIDLDEYRRHPHRYVGMTLSERLLALDDAWLVLPLFFNEELLACLLFERSSVQSDINWEDRDLLKTAGRQAATLMKQEKTQSSLSEASQFQAFSKMSAYIVHDLKNIIGQQSLLVSNAARHKHKPEFVEDVITTVDNSVKRMNALLEQLRANSTDDKAVSIDVVDTLQIVVSQRSKQKPVPLLAGSNTPLLVLAEPARLNRMFGHLIQNAQEATPAEGSVAVRVSVEQSSALISIKDTGSGMTQDFIRNSLYKAFESTKGLTGMGIGMFESREYVNSLGGEISVSSKPGEGTEFVVTIPLASQNPESVNP